jgi:hypothetical protein
MILSYRYRLFTTAAQEAALTDMLGAFCDLYNAGLQQRIEAYRRQRYQPPLRQPSRRVEGGPRSR